MSNTPDTNPLLGPSKLPYGAPPLDSVKVEHFLPAQKIGIEEAKREIAAIKTSKAPAHNHTVEIGIHAHTVYVGPHAHAVTINSTGNNENTVKNIAFNAIVRLA